MKAVTNHPTTTSTTICWLSDTHLDKMDSRQTKHLLDGISKTAADHVVISGDISSARSLTHQLVALASACRPRPVCFVTGNHDYYGSSFAAVDADLNALCAEVENLHYLNGQQIIPLNRNTSLIGHCGWPDARAGYGIHTYLRSPDHRAIQDFHGLDRKECMLLMRQLGKHSADRIRRILPLALTRYRHVIFLTHTPPFPEAVRFNELPCGPLHLPHYANLSAGLAIRAIARAFPARKITILAGHSHSAGVTHIGRNICVRVAHARTGRTGPHEILRIS